MPISSISLESLNDIHITYNYGISMTFLKLYCVKIIRYPNIVSQQNITVTVIHNNPEKHKSYDALQIYIYYYQHLKILSLCTVYNIFWLCRDYVKQGNVLFGSPQILQAKLVNHSKKTFCDNPKKYAQTQLTEFRPTVYFDGSNILVASSPLW